VKPLMLKDLEWRPWSSSHVWDVATVPGGYELFRTGFAPLARALGVQFIWYKQPDGDRDPLGEGDALAAQCWLASLSRAPHPLPTE
jgi:hypothetical protein